MKQQKIEHMLAQLGHIEQAAIELEVQYAEVLSKVHPDLQKSARNLVHYRALRQHDIRDLQTALGNLGMSRLGRAESHVLASVRAAQGFLRLLLQPGKKRKFRKAEVSIKRGNKLLNAHAKALLGYRSRGRRVRMMVTFPSDAAQDGQLVHNLVAAGMNSARINCAHDDAATWKQMIDHIHKAKAAHRRNCKISMDLGGPKIRTGSMEEGPKVVHFRPERDPLGRVVGPAVICLMPDDEPYPLLEEGIFLPVPRSWLASLDVGTWIDFIDTRGKRRSFRVMRSDDKQRWVHCYDGGYVITGTVLHRRDQPEEEIQIGEMPPIEQKILLRIGDTLVLHKADVPGEPAAYDEDGGLLREAHIACTSHEVFAQVQVGQRILFDDGKMTGIIRSVTEEELRVDITYAKEGGAKLRADKGLNFPDTQLNLRGLTDKDRQDLAFVAAHADVVNMSFVNTPQDVQDLLDEIEKLGAKDQLGLILKIETRQGFDNLTDILLTAMQTHPVGVMIARGDLAVEVGWQHMARIQEEIMSLCGAAHVPVVWATQVLESLAKKGLPSRAEITDAAMAQRAECVMLNKGPYILRAIEMLDTILKKMKEFHNKKAPMLPVLESKQEVEKTTPEEVVMAEPML